MLTIDGKVTKRESLMRATAFVLDSNAYACPEPTRRSSFVMPDRLFSYCIEIASREFMIAVTCDGTIRWDDYKQRRRQRSDDDRALELHALAGSERARKRLAAEIDEFTVSFRLSPEMFARFTEAAHLFDSDQWTDAHEQELDRHLLPLFWSDVNPHLLHPIER